MAKQNNKQTRKQVSNVTKGLTAATFSTNGQKGKPQRPEGMSDAEWFKVMVNIRVPRTLKALEACARLASIKGFDSAIGERIINDIRSRFSILKDAYGNPKPNKVVRKEKSHYVV